MAGKVRVLTSIAGTLLRLRLAFKALTSPVAFGASALVETRDGRIALIRQRFVPGFHLPGGGVDYGEAPAKAAWREAMEEVGLTAGDAPVFFGLYTRKMGLATNVIALYHIANAELSYKPGFEVVEMVLADPRDPPAQTGDATKKRLAEFLRQAPVSEYW